MQMGHHVLGNEFSFYMLLASAYVLNHSARLHQVRRRAGLHACLAGGSWVRWPTNTPSYPPQTSLCTHRQWTVHPWLHSGCNHFTSASQLRGLAIPDVLPEDLTGAGTRGLRVWGLGFVIEQRGCWACQAGADRSVKKQRAYLSFLLPYPSSSSPAPGELGMVAGDFVEVFARPEYQAVFDVVATCFFIDTAHNVIDYLETIVAVLKARMAYRLALH